MHYFFIMSSTLCIIVSTYIINYICSIQFILCIKIYLYYLSQQIVNFIFIMSSDDFVHCDQMSLKYYKNF